MKSVLLIGLGRFGRFMAEKLSELGNDVLAVDKDEERVNNALKLVSNAQIGDATNERFIASLGVRDFDLCVVTVADDFQSSLETTSLLKDYGAPFVLARAIDDNHAKFLLRNGADDVIHMEKQVAAWTAVKYSNDSIFEYMQLTPEYAIYETSLPDIWLGKTVVDIDVRRKFNINILGTKLGGVLTPLSDPAHVFAKGETLLILGADKDMRKFLKLVE